MIFSVWIESFAIAPTNQKKLGRSDSTNMKSTYFKIINKKATKEDFDKFYSEFSLLKQYNIEEYGKFKLSELRKVYKWIQVAEKSGIKVEITDYKKSKCWNDVNSLFDLNFYKNRYYKYDYLKIYDDNKKFLLEKRGSMYDPKNIATKNNISLDDAVKLSEIRKQKTKITKENLIKKYGEESGLAKYQSFVNSSKTSIENYKKRYGENWKERWDYFISTRDSSSLDFHIKKYGELEGGRIFAQKIIEFKKSSDLNYFNQKYGDKGEDIFDSINRKKGEGSRKSWSLEFFREKNKEILLEKTEQEILFLFESFKKTRCNKTVEYYLNKGFSIEEAKILRQNKIEELYRGPTSRGSVSSQSIKFFEKLSKKLNRECIFGHKKDEFCIKTEDKIYFYDFFDPQSNTIIEFNGSLYHAPEILTDEERGNWKCPYGLSWNEVYEKDRKKINAAKSRGYNILVVWDYETDRKYKILKKIDELVSFLNKE